MNFGEALNTLKEGGRVTRAGWNGRGMYVVYQKGYPEGIPINANTAQATGIQQGTVCVFRPYLMIQVVDGSLVPWVIGPTDALADDWEEIPMGERVG